MKVIGFDNWTGGAHLFERLTKAFSVAGLDLTLIHLGSWGNDVGRPECESIGSLQVRDISIFGQKGFPEILEAEKPAAVLFMSTDTFAHRAFNRYCRDRHIPTIHLYHGLVRVQAVDDGLPYKINLFSQLKFALGKLRKAFRHVWPAYAAALWRTGAKPREWFRFFHDILQGAAGIYNRVAADDARTDKCCVYVAPDIEHAVTKYGFAREDVIAVGNPDLMQFGLTSDHIGSHLASGQLHRTDVMYADTGLVYAGYGACLFTSENEFIEHLVDTKQQLEKQGKHLIFKPHPDHWRSGIIPVLQDRGVDVCPNADFVSRLSNCCACIVEPTTVAVIPALMGIPLFLAGYGKLHGQQFGEVLTSYPRAMALTDLQNVSGMLDAEQASFNRENTMKWISETSGPLPAEDMPHRVAALAATLILESQPARM